MRRVRLLHVTEFAYDAPVSESYNEVHLRPRDDDAQSCLAFRLSTRPRSVPHASRDYFGNWLHHFNVLAPHTRLRVEAESMVLVQDQAPDPAGGMSLEELDRRRAALLEEHYDYLVPSTHVPAVPTLETLVHSAEIDGRAGAADFAHAATALIKSRFRYAPGATHVHSSVSDVLRSGAGVCQDFAHLLIGVARGRGLPARYVSGYLIPPEEPAEAAHLEAVSGALASHAWAEVFVPGNGWLGFDPTLGTSVGRQHVRIAYGRDYADVAPVRGVHRGQAGQRLSVDVHVRPLVDGDGNERWGLRPTDAHTPDAPQQ